MDLALLQADEFTAADISLINGAPVIDDGLQTAVYISLFTDRATEEGGGWWAEPDFGSRLWTLSRQKMLPGIADTAAGYCKEALQWLLDEEIASQIDVTVSILAGTNLSIAVDILQPDGTGTVYKYNWSAQAAGIDYDEYVEGKSYDGSYHYAGTLTYGG